MRRAEPWRRRRQDAAGRAPPGDTCGLQGLRAGLGRAAAACGDKRDGHNGKTEPCHPCTAEPLALGRHGGQGDGDRGEQGRHDCRDGQHPGVGGQEETRLRGTCQHSADHARPPAPARARGHSPRGDPGCAGAGQDVCRAERADVGGPAQQGCGKDLWPPGPSGARTRLAGAASAAQAARPGQGSHQTRHARAVADRGTPGGRGHPRRSRQRSASPAGPGPRQRRAGFGAGTARSALR